MAHKLRYINSYTQYLKYLFSDFAHFYALKHKALKLTYIFYS